MNKIHTELLEILGAKSNLSDQTILKLEYFFDKIQYQAYSEGYDDGYEDSKSVIKGN